MDMKEAVRIAEVAEDAAAAVNGEESLEKKPRSYIFETRLEAAEMAMVEEYAIVQEELARLKQGGELGHHASAAQACEALLECLRPELASHGLAEVAAVNTDPYIAECQE